jgi:hypothetical protein
MLSGRRPAGRGGVYLAERQAAGKHRPAVRRDPEVIIDFSPSLWFRLARAIDLHPVLRDWAVRVSGFRDIFHGLPDRFDNTSSEEGNQASPEKPFLDVVDKVEFLGLIMTF